jgi:DNA-binding Lrp family transcriptional regulator
MEKDDTNAGPQSSNGEEAVTLFRGLSVPESDVARVSLEVRQQGLKKVKGMTWASTMASPAAIREMAAELRINPSTIRQSIRTLEQEHVICGCGDEFSASGYAGAYSRSGERYLGLMVSYSMAPGSLAIDGKDFLYTVFQLWDRHQTRHLETVRDFLGQIYGKKILNYFDLAAETKCSDERIGLCDLACVDLEIVRHHYQNQILIHGRCQRRFFSAFQMQAPVLPEQIISVNPAQELSAPSCRLISFLDFIS